MALFQSQQHDMSHTIATKKGYDLITSQDFLSLVPLKNIHIFALSGGINELNL